MIAYCTKHILRTEDNVPFSFYQYLYATLPKVFLLYFNSRAAKMFIGFVYRMSKYAKQFLPKIMFAGSYCSSDSL